MISSVRTPFPVLLSASRQSRLPDLFCHAPGKAVRPVGRRQNGIFRAANGLFGLNNMIF